MSFIDTNVLVYSAVNNAPFRDRARNALARFGASGPLLISRQILREYLAVMTREQVWAKPLTLACCNSRFADSDMVSAGPFPSWPGLTRPSAHERSGVDGRVRPGHDGRGLGPMRWNAKMRTAAFGGRQVHDANIVATMLAHRERRLVTFNGGDFRRFAGLIDVVTP